MLIALVSLFALPFVIGANLEPIIRDSESSASATSGPIITYPEDNPNLANTDSDVLGVTTTNNPLLVTENKDNLSFFNVNTSESGSTKYELSVETTQVFGRIELFSIKNDTTQKQTYRFNATQDDDADGTRYLYIDSSEFVIGTPDLPEYVHLETGETISFALMNNQYGTTAVTITVELANGDGTVVEEEKEEAQPEVKIEETEEKPAETVVDTTEDAPAGNPFLVP